MKLLLQIYIITSLFFSFVSSAQVIEKEAHYDGNLTWLVDNIKIQQTSITRTKNNGPFKTVESLWGELQVSYNDNTDNAGLLITTTDVSEHESIKTGYNRSQLPFLWKSTAAYEIIDGNKPLIIYLVKKEQSNEFNEWEKKSTKYKKDILRYNNLSYREKRQITRPVLPFKPSQQYEYKIINEYHISFKYSPIQEREYWDIVDTEKGKANTQNLFIIVGVGLFLWAVWFAIKKIKSGLSKAKKKTSDKFQKIKEKKRQAEVRRITEATVISETVKNEINKVESKDLSQLRIQIAEAVEVGDYNKADTLLKLAERLKNLES